MKNFLTQLLFLFFGMIVMAISLFSANTIHSQGENSGFSSRKLYLSDKIIPDHVLYPLVVGVDQLKLRAASPAMRPWVRLVYAQRRIGYAEELLRKGHLSLAFSTLTKACKYHLQALVELSDSQDLGAEMVLKESLEFREKVQLLRPSFSDSDQQELDRLLAEQDMILQK